jgi:hypothetical protein
MSPGLPSLFLAVLSWRYRYQEESSSMPLPGHDRQSFDFNKSSYLITCTVLAPVLTISGLQATVRLQQFWIAGRILLHDEAAENDRHTKVSEIEYLALLQMRYESWRSYLTGIRSFRQRPFLRAPTLVTSLFLLLTVVILTAAIHIVAKTTVRVTMAPKRAEDEDTRLRCQSMDGLAFLEVPNASYWVLIVFCLFYFAAASILTVSAIYAANLEGAKESFRRFSIAEMMSRHGDVEPPAQQRPHGAEVQSDQLPPC